jgi:hypothetical protein
MGPFESEHTINESKGLSVGELEDSTIEESSGTLSPKDLTESMNSSTQQEETECVSCPCDEHYENEAVDVVYDNLTIDRLFELIHGGYPNSTYSSSHSEVELFLWKVFEERHKLEGNCTP